MLLSLVYASNSDNLIEKGGEVVPIEIKSGKPDEMNIYNHSALNGLIASYGIKKAYLFGEAPFKKESGIITRFPIHNIAFLKPDNR